MAHIRGYGLIGGAREMLLGATVTLATVALLSGCGSSSSSSAQASSTGQSSNTSSVAASPAATTPAATSSDTATAKDPCTVVTAAEIMSATGKTVAGAPMHGNQFLCEFPTTGGGTVNIGIASPVTAANFQSHGQGKPPVSGIGDMAYQSDFGVSVLVGSTSISVELSPVPGGNYLDPATKLARLVISRL